MKALSLLLVSLFLTGAIPVLTPVVRALDATDLVDLLDGWDGGGSGVLSASLADSEKVTVTGTVTGATEPLLLDIGSGVTVVWEAALSGTVDGRDENNGQIRLIGSGIFEIAKNGSISCSGSHGYAINAIGSNGTILVSGGTVSTTSGIAIYAPSAGPGDDDPDNTGRIEMRAEVPGLPDSPDLLDSPDLPDDPVLPDHPYPMPTPEGGEIIPGPLPVFPYTFYDVVLTGGTVSATTGVAILARDIYVKDGSAVTVASTGSSPAVILDNDGSIIVQAGELTVNGDILEGGYAISADNGARVTLNGNIIGAIYYGVDASDSSIVNVNGSIQSGFQGSGIYAYSGAEVTIVGNITVEDYGVVAYGGATVTVTGNVEIGDYAQGVVAGWAGTTVIVNGDVSAGNNGDGARAYGEGTTIINGNVSAGRGGAIADNGGKVTINGTINAEIYVYLYNEDAIGSKESVLGINDDSPSTKPGYREYTDGRNTVWVSSDAWKVAADKDRLTWDVIKGDNTSQDSVTDNLSLPVTGMLGTAITWESSDVSVIPCENPNMGFVIRPRSGEAAAPVTLTATVISGNVSDTVMFELVVLAYPPEHAQNTEADLAWLTWDVIKKANSSQTRVTSDLSLPTVGANGSVISWHYLETAVDRPFDLETGVLTRPPFGSGNTNVQIAAILIFESSLRVKLFGLTVLEEPSGISTATGGYSGGSPPDPEEIIESEPEPDIPLAESWDNPYADVVDADWFYAAVQFVTERGLMNGTGDAEFSPNVIISRAMLVTVLYRLDGKPAVSGDIPFLDVKSGEWYSDAILWASEHGIVLGYDSATFGLNDPVTREQAVAIIHRYAKYKDLDVSQSADLTLYTDADDISDWALDAMKWAVAAGIIQGRTPTTIAPQGTSTRAEIAMVFKRFVEGVGHTPNNS